MQGNDWNRAGDDIVCPTCGARGTVEQRLQIHPVAGDRLRRRCRYCECEWWADEEDDDV